MLAWSSTIRKLTQILSFESISDPIYLSDTELKATWALITFQGLQASFSLPARTCKCIISTVRLWQRMEWSEVSLLELATLSRVPKAAHIHSRTVGEVPLQELQMAIMVSTLAIDRLLGARLTISWPIRISLPSSRTSNLRLWWRAPRSDQSLARTYLRYSDRTSMAVGNEGMEVTRMLQSALVEVSRPARPHITFVRTQTKSSVASLMTLASCFTSRKSWSKDSLKISWTPASWTWRCLQERTKRQWTCKWWDHRRTRHQSLWAKDYSIQASTTPQILVCMIISDRHA